MADNKKYLDFNGLGYIIRKINSQKASIESPDFTGTPTAPTVSTSWRDNKIATTKFVHDVMDEIALNAKNAAQVIFTITPTPISPILIKLTNQETGTIYEGYTNDLGIAYINVSDCGIFNISYGGDGFKNAINSITISQPGNVYPVNVTYSTGVEYTAIIDLANSNPLTCVTYADDATGMTKGSNDWDNLPIFKDIRPCTLQNGSVNYYLNPSNFNYREDGVTPANLDGSDGDIMIQFSKFAYRIYKDNGKLYVSVTDDAKKVAADSRYHYYAFSRESEGDRDYFYWGAYKGSLNADGNLASVIGKAPAANETIGIFKRLARNRGSGYTITSFFQLTAIQCLYIIKYGNLDGQSTIGKGITRRFGAIGIGDLDAPDITGGSSGYETADKGMNYGSNEDINTHVKIFGIEDFWGNIEELIDGLTTDNNSGNINIITNWDYNKAGNNNDFSFPSGSNGSSGHINDVAGTTEAGFMNILHSGSSNTYFCDDGYLTQNRFLYFGGHWNSGSYAGPFCMYANYYVDYSEPDKYKYSYIGARLMYL